MKATKESVKIKKSLSKMFPDAVINDDLTKYCDAPVVLKKAEEAKRFLANFKYF